jgi:hypothetical protein
MTASARLPRSSVVPNLGIPAKWEMMKARAYIQYKSFLRIRARFCALNFRNAWLYVIGSLGIAEFADFLFEGDRMVSKKIGRYPAEASP